MAPGKLTGNAFDYRYVKRGIYDAQVDRFTAKLRRIKVELRDLKRFCERWHIEPEETDDD